jgi:hypothetical protein
MPIGLMHHGTTTLAQINEWWRGRGIPVLRDNLDDVLRKAEASIPEELLYRNLGLSLSDQYWIRPAGADVRWDDVNFFTNGLEAAGKAVGSVRPRPATPAEPNAHPDNTSDGNLEKRWVERGGKRLLIKGARNNGQEPYNEAVATALHSRLLNPDDYVAYTLEQEGGRPVCACENFLTDHEEYVPAHYVAMLQEQGATTTDYRHYVECCKELGVRDIEQSLAKMIVCDDIIANHDRHWRNFGLIRNVDTLECRPAPLFDSGSSLWCDIALDALAAGGHSFTSKPFDDRPAHQLLLVDDFSWASPSALDGFVEEAVAILQQNEWLGPRIPYIRSALEHRVRRMADIIEWS